MPAVLVEPLHERRDERPEAVVLANLGSDDRDLGCPAWWRTVPASGVRAGGVVVDVRRCRRMSARIGGLVGGPLAGSIRDPHASEQDEMVGSGLANGANE